MFYIPGPIVSSRITRKISSYLVRAKLYPLERKVGSERYGKSRCEVCLNIQETDTFTSATTGKTFKCSGKQYVGETTDEFRLRWNSYKSNDRKNARNEAFMREH